MSETTATAEVAEANAVPKAKKPRKAATKKPAPSGPANRSVKTGLRKPQVRILKALAKASKPLTRAAIAEKASVDAAGCVEWIGSADEATRKTNDAKHFPSLVTLGLLRQERHDADGRDVVLYTVTAKGKAEAAKG